jgi:hypothetical protein
MTATIASLRSAAAVVVGRNARFGCDGSVAIAIAFGRSGLMRRCYSDVDLRIGLGVGVLVTASRPIQHTHPACDSSCASTDPTNASFSASGD